MIDLNGITFFDARPVRKAVDRATRAALSKAGAFVRQTARSLIRPRQRSARPGEPPSSHKGDLRRLIYFGYEAQRRTVVVGPAPLGGGGGGGGRRNAYGPKTIPQILEEGGNVTAAARGEAGDRVRRRYRGHPYMGPAMEKELPNFPRLWKDSVKR